MGKRRELCGSRNTISRKPCRLPKQSCPHDEHRRPDRADTPADVTLVEPESTSSAPVHPDGPSAASLRSALVRHSRGDLVPSIIERDYWMFQVALCMGSDIPKHPGVSACLSGGSMLAAVGITQRLSEDADFSVAVPGGLAACSNKHGKRLLDALQCKAATRLGITAEHLGPGGGNLFRKIHYRYPSVLTGAHDPIVQSDMGIRDIDPAYILKLSAQPYLARAGASLPHGYSASEIVCMHPITVLVDKLDAVCWRESTFGAAPDRALASLVARIRDHYDIYMLLKWLDGRGWLSAQSIEDAVTHMLHSDDGVRARRNINRPRVQPPDSGYRSLRVWQPGTPQYEHMLEAHPSLRTMVYGHLPAWEQIAAEIRGCPSI